MPLLFFQMFPMWQEQAESRAGSQEQLLGSSHDLECSLDDVASFNAANKLRSSLSSIECAEDYHEAANSCDSEDMLSSKDSLNSIPGTPTKVTASGSACLALFVDSGRCNNAICFVFLVERKFVFEERWQLETGTGIAATSAALQAATVRRLERVCRLFGSAFLLQRRNQSQKLETAEEKRLGTRPANAGAYLMPLSFRFPPPPPQPF